MSRSKAFRPAQRATLRSGIALLGALFVSMCCGVTSASAETLKQAAAHQVVMQLADDAFLVPMLDYLERERHLGYRPDVEQIPKRPVYLLSVHVGDVGKTLKLLNRKAQGDNPQVVFAEGNAIVSTDDWLWCPPPGCDDHDGDGLRLPATQAKLNSVLAIDRAPARNEPPAVNQLLRLNQAHAISTGAGIRVAILDTGTDPDHPAFSGTFSPSGQRDFIDDDLDPTEGGTPITKLKDWAPSDVGHGTHVTGIVHRVAPAAQLMVGRILDPQGTGTTWLTAKAIFWAVDPDANGVADTDGAHVINLSLDTPVATQVLRLAVNVVTCANVPGPEPEWSIDWKRCAIGGGGGTPFDAVVAAAVGNDASETLLQYPAAYQIPGLLAVAASDNRENGTDNRIRKMAFFTNSGAYVDVAAPGYGIFSQFFDNSRAHISGTSMAAPMVSGLAALLRAQNPTWSAADAMRGILDSTVPMCDTTEFGHIDVAGALGAAPLSGACPP